MYAGSDPASPQRSLAGSERRGSSRTEGLRCEMRSRSCCVAEADRHTDQRGAERFDELRLERRELLGWDGGSCKNGAGRSSGSGCAHVRENEERGERKEKDESPLKVRRRVFPHVDVHRAGSRPGDDEGGMEVYASLLISWLHPAMWEI